MTVSISPKPDGSSASNLGWDMLLILLPVLNLTHSKDAHKIVKHEEIIKRSGQNEFEKNL